MYLYLKIVINLSQITITKEIKCLLKNKKITGCCLDVLDFEDISFENIKKNKDFDFLKNSNNVILTPHIAGWTIESKLKLSKVIIEKIKEL